MAEFVAVLLMWHLNASMWWWVAFVLIFILNVAHEMNKIYNKKQERKNNKL